MSLLHEAEVASQHRGSYWGEQMPFLILAYDHEGMEVKREQVRDAHRTYLGAQGRKLLASGALLAVDGRTVIGGASLFDTDEYKEAARFEAEDPYAKTGIRARVEILEWRLRWWLGQFSASGHRP
jgi:uncharacterized protein YciI